jgi:NADH dehydrogenase (ubiquinone) 1 beta subcomplex subunit 5
MNIYFYFLAIRQSSDHVFRITPTKFQWHKFKDLFHFYLMLGVIPLTALVMYVNIFIGPATLTPTPEGYVPKHWEYHPHPISRFIARYIHPSPQEDYEKTLHGIYEEQQKIKLRRLEKDIRKKMAERRDYQAYYYRPMMAKYHRVAKQVADELEALEGDQ